MVARQHIWKNISFALVTLLLWAAARLLHVRVFHGQTEGFRSFDVLFIFLPPLAAFFLNWYWMREERTETQIKWAVSWSAIDLVIFVPVIFLLGNPLHELIVWVSK